MRIVSCHIENFGKLHDVSIDFEKGIHTVCEENGWGKSTFAAFIRAMFYGLEGERKRSVEDNERKRYQPWQGGIFGGQLLFEVNGKKYQIARVFRDKEQADEFELRDAETNLISKEYSKKIGEELFKINRESFMRSIFIGQNGCETAATDDINAKIGNLSEHTNDLNSFDAAYTRLTEILNGLNPGRVTGSIARRKEKLAELERSIQDRKGLEESIESYRKFLKEKEERYEVLKEEMDETGKLQTRVSKLQAILGKKEHWERLKEIESSGKSKEEASRRSFPGPVPVLTELTEKIERCMKMEKAVERMELYRFSEAEGVQYSRLSQVFFEQIPTEAQLEEITGDINQFVESNRQYQAIKMSPAEERRLKELEEMHDGETDVNLLLGRWNDRNMKKGTLPSKQAALATLSAAREAEKNRKSKKFIFFVFWTILLLVTGIFVILNYSVAIGICVLLAGIAIFITGYIVNRKRKKEKSDPNMLELKRLMEDIEADNKYICNVDREISNYFEKRGRSFTEQNVSAFLQEISAESVEYTTLRKKAVQAEAGKLAEVLKEKSRKIQKFMSLFGVQTGELRFLEDLFQLKNDVSTYKALSQKHINFEAASKVYKQIYKELASFLDKYGYVCSDKVLSRLNDIREKVISYEEIKRRWQEAKQELNTFEANADMNVLYQEEDWTDLPTLEEMNGRILQITDEMESVQGAILSYNNILEDLQNQSEELEEDRQKYLELKMTQEEEIKKYKYIQAARAKLVLAKESMTAKYAAPIYERFTEYYDILTDCLCPKQFHIDANTNVTVDELGKQRETNTLSAGFRDLIGISLRIALVDVMYQEEKPIIIMDDPFTNLDDRKLRAAKVLLDNISSKYQIIYFTCSDTRCV